MDDAEDTDGRSMAEEEETTDERFRFLGRRFQDDFEALRETHTELTQAAEQLDDPSIQVMSFFRDRKSLNVDQLESIKNVFEGIPDEGLSGSDLFDALVDAVGDQDWGAEFIVGFARRMYRPRREPIFHNAMLISVISKFEVHLARLAEAYYRSAPAALHDVPKDSVKEFSLRDLQAMDSVDDAIDIAIESRISKLMFGSLSDLRKFFADRMQIDMAKVVSGWQDVLEIFERRHCIVHSDGNASRRYIRNYPKYKLNQPLNADAEYVHSALDILELLGVLLQVQEWVKFTNNEQEVIDSLESTAFEALKQERWSFSLALYEFWRSLPLSHAEKRMAAINIWIARKALHGLQSIREEVEAWDVSDSDELYIFAKMCVLEDLDEAFKALPDLIARDKIDGQSLATWPLVHPLRQDDRIRRYKELMKEFLSEETETNESEPGDTAAKAPQARAESEGKSESETLSETDASAQ